MREHLASLTAADPSTLVSYMEKDGKFQVRWSSVTDVDRVVGILDRMKFELLAASRNP